MTDRPDIATQLSNHTFGRNHFRPMPSPTELQMESGVQQDLQMGGRPIADVCQSAELPHDLDQRIRSVGEW